MRTWLPLGVGGSVLYAVLGVTRVCAAQPLVNEFEVNLFGRYWHVASYFVQDDLLQNSNEDTFFEPEGLAFRNGLLYASGDREADETNSRLAIYDCPAAGPLSFDHFIQMPSSSPNWWGPEGLAFNTAGSGYGSGASQLVSVDRDSGQAGLIDLVAGSVTDRVNIGTPEDVTFLPGRGQLAVLQDWGASIGVVYRNTDMTDTGQQFAVAPGTNGLVRLSASFGSWLTRTSCSAEVLLAVTRANPGPAVLVYDLAGTQIGPQQSLPVEPKARIPLGGPFYMLLPAFGAPEAVAVDEANRMLFIGDESNTMIHVLTLGPPAADLNRDGHVDADDLSIFLACSTGPAIKYDPQNLPSGCGVADAAGIVPADLDRDADMDQADFGIFQRCYSGANKPADPNCID